ncbi:pyrroloquinoline quinone biosynthesis protein PqqB [Aureibaculum sp. A20]|uniref:Pyrroloquinoline quinone biosynthesis protein PqqB n=1 Tax=Aureibaculum flavum TaxID=2795986 RepID=A0ABS0WWC5_9FLAO|nr:MBL fold metallo-hydrolase [Aureibaculum flavum]MBJ2176257.1 pyrroloquinoline quinone biosynthesis protein PqqB [Aureibaculum flavum]
MKKGIISVIILITLFSCKDKVDEKSTVPAKSNNPYILVLGNAQDAGYPQIACQKECCNRVSLNPELKRFVSSIAVVDPISNESWIFDATPDFTAQTKLLSRYVKDKPLPDGIFLTHAHIGHYTGLMFLGREALGAIKMPVFAMPKMQQFLTENGPWSQLIELENIDVKPLQKDSIIILNSRISVQPIQVPHRDEFSETVGFIIKNQHKKALYIPDIDKWEKWNRKITDYIKEVDLAIVDATFFKEGEINRDMSEVPHPFVEESLALFENLSEGDKMKVFFIHFNHTNPLLIEGSDAQKLVQNKGFNIAKQGLVISF